VICSGIIAYYNFNGDSLDKTGFSHNADVYSAVLGTDKFGNANSAYYFDSNSLNR